ncbi:transposase [Colletotrichum costaricense]|uniref:Transposase n=1 Tax=Colletotrichum costaricense TaxID=1209916 RepID=A0AAI9Z4V8_9PEZI|nr:transposase [Colletotrichum costaricense]KAK1532902.1 transposase [Colletotrichum costaricense]
MLGFLPADPFAVQPSPTSSPMLRPPTDRTGSPSTTPFSMDVLQSTLGRDFPQPSWGILTDGPAGPIDISPLLPGTPASPALLQRSNFSSARQCKRRCLEKWNWRKNDTESARQLRRDGKSPVTPNKKTARQQRRPPINSTSSLLAEISARTCGLCEKLLHWVKSLIFRSSKEDVEWRQLNRVGRLPVFGQELTSQVAVGLEHFASGDPDSGFPVLSHMFWDLGDFVRKSDITIYATLLLDIPSIFYEFKNEVPFLNKYFLYLHSLFGEFQKGDSPIANAVQAMGQLTAMDFDQARGCLSQLYRVVADAYEEIQGRDTFDSIERHVEAINATGSTPDTQEVGRIITALDNMQILAASHQGQLQSPNIIEYELWKIELLRSIETGNQFVSRCNRLLESIATVAIDKEWRLWEPWLLWICGEVMYELCRFFDKVGNDEEWAENLEGCILRFRCAITMDETWEELLGWRVVLYRLQLVEFWTEAGKPEQAEKHKRCIRNSACWEAMLREHAELPSFFD